MNGDALSDVSKDHLILAMLAVLGGEKSEINERDLFLASWHAFPNTMRWVDTALPNPDTFTASLRRLDKRGHIARVGKQERTKRRPRRRKTVLDPGRSGVVKARIAEGGLEQAGVSKELIDQVRKLVPASEATRVYSAAQLITLAIALRDERGQQIDEGALVELAFHKFADRFAYPERPEFPDTGRIREAVSAARAEGLIDDAFELSEAGRAFAADQRGRVEVRLDVSEGHKAGDLKFADRIEQTTGFQAYAEHGTLVATKADELFRALRVAPTTNPAPVADALRTRTRALQRIDKGQIAAYLLDVAQKHNPEVATLIENSNGPQDEAVSASNEEKR